VGAGVGEIQKAFKDQLMLFEMPQEEDSGCEMRDKQNATGCGIEKPLNQRLSMSNKIHDVLALVEPGCCVHWVSEGEWSVHDLLLGLLQMAGPSDVFISSYAFSEYPARLLADLKERKIITQLFCLIDSRIDKRSASALTLVRNCADNLKLVHTHAKVTVIENEQSVYCIVGSANYTSNKRYEAGVIIADEAVAAFHKKWISDELAKTK
jgi:hypothetical protein